MRGKSERKNKAKESEEEEEEKEKKKKRRRKRGGGGGEGGGKPTPDSPPTCLPPGHRPLLPRFTCPNQAAHSNYHYKHLPSFPSPLNTSLQSLTILTCLIPLTFPPTSIFPRQSFPFNFPSSFNSLSTIFSSLNFTSTLSSPLIFLHQIFPLSINFPFNYHPVVSI